jgi:hypothetical protein
MLSDSRTRAGVASHHWLSDMDSNHDKSLQRALCYHYTIGQTALKIAFPARLAKQNSRPDAAGFGR